MKLQCVTIQMEAIEQYFHVVLFIMLYKVILTFKCVDETPVWTFKWKLSSSTLSFMVEFIMLCTYESILICSCVDIILVVNFPIQMMM